jgi:hypothetical protein
MKRFLITISLLLILPAALFGPRLYKELTSSLEVEVMEGPAIPAIEINIPPDTNTIENLGRQLKAAGINHEPLLGDTGIALHLQRVQEEKIALQELQQYADDLQFLKQYTSARRAFIPSSFWDVRTKEMEAKEWTEYSLVHQLTQPEWRPYLQLLTQAYGRFLKFKRLEKVGKDSALDASLDMFAMVEDYFHAVPFASITEHAKEITGETEAVLMIWQSIVTGTSRINPLSGKPMFSHSIFARNNVDTMYQYTQEKPMSTGKVWGVSGFAPRFVGIPHNDNQIEHMSISMVIQVLLHEPLAILDGIEEEKILTGKSPPEESHADMTLNKAIHKEFLPYFPKNRLGAVENLRRKLKKI